MTLPITGKINYRRGDIVWVAFPFSNQLGKKERPALVLSSDQYNQSQDDLLLVQISSHIRRAPDIGECEVVDWRLAGLDGPSAVRPKLFTVESSLVIRAAGHITDSDMQRVEAALRVVTQL